MKNAPDFQAVFEADEMEVRQALAQVSEIREHLARTEVFRGYRSLTVGFSGLVGLTAAAIQASWLPKPTEQIGSLSGAVDRRGGNQFGRRRR